MSPRPGAADVTHAAALLGVDVYDLGVALRSHAHGRFIAEANRVTARGGRPELKIPNSLLAAAEGCERAIIERNGPRS